MAVVDALEDRCRANQRLLRNLKADVCNANQRLVTVDEGLKRHTWGNVSGVNRELGVMVIKPSGMAYEKMAPDLMVVVSLDDGKRVEGDLRPSCDTPTHLHLYRAFPDIGGIVHTHVKSATAWAQAGREIPVLGTTHADYFDGPIPVTRQLTKEEIEGQSEEEYEANTGRAIVERFRELGFDPARMPAVLVVNHAPFTWGKSPDDAVSTAAYLELVASLATETLALNPEAHPLSRALLDKHFLRKHGPKKYYGQE